MVHILGILGPTQGHSSPFLWTSWNVSLVKLSVFKHVPRNLRVTDWKISVARCYWACFKQSASHCRSNMILRSQSILLINLMNTAPYYRHQTPSKSWPALFTVTSDNYTVLKSMGHVCLQKHRFPSPTRCSPQLVKWCALFIGIGWWSLWISWKLDKPSTLTSISQH